MKKVLFLLVLNLVSLKLAISQCAMCKASAETSLESGASDLAITFGMLGFMGYLLYKGNKATRSVD